MDMLPEPVSNVLHREIKRVHHLIDDVEERVSSIQETQTAGMVQVHRRIEKLEMDSEDIQEALKRFLSGSVGDLKPDPHNSVSAPDSNSRDFEAADEGKADGEDPQGSLRVRRSPSPELAEAFERIVKLERALIWICVEDKSSYTSRSLKAEKVLSLFESTAEVQRMSHLPKKELEFIQLGAMSTDQQLNSHQREKEDLPSIRDQALKRNCTGDLEHQAERDSSSIIARASDTEKTERLKADSVDDEDAVAKTHKVLEAYGIDLYVEP